MTNLLKEQPKGDVLDDLVGDVLGEVLELVLELHLAPLGRLHVLLGQFLLGPQPRILVVDVSVLETEVPSLEDKLVIIAIRLSIVLTFSSFYLDAWVKLRSIILHFYESTSIRLPFLFLSII